ncbi:MULTISPECIES: MipA/OmpV family protein [Paracoccus]|uniref:Outer membrane protein n=1 Tax=Paracoccus versutus TaxID=34007 RepID=A0A369UAQ0_PARVE|nr:MULTISPECIES: MipA/OmpV family protein [Paracoccus]WGR59640.1 MipA/OmpV family protein [Paracoccus ferrooxidans]MBT0778901.1 MipA/OmpV family protein [Paracoccus sp. pheM1]RDD72246.1 MipA/OmpV family protein [Paracoccus versutus]REF68896.1 outer membrane protein [Paracoccus versutus]WGR57064.1 MipA/OmpV family protein [Paracoccus versutus]
MTRIAALALLAATALTSPAAAQSLGLGRGLSVDAGLGVKYSPEFMGSDNLDASPWIILRNGDADRGKKDGISILPSLNYVGKRDADDHEDLRGMRDIGRAGEFGVKLSWRMGDMTSYGAIRKGFGGHHGVAGELGAKYRYEVNDRLTLWTGAELGLGDQDFVGTYFGVDGNESRPGRAAHSPDGGAYIARVSVEARYEFMPDTALMGRLTYGRLLGDAGDSPLVQTRSQPSISIGVARRLNFRF